MILGNFAKIEIGNDKETHFISETHLTLNGSQICQNHLVNHVRTLYFFKILTMF